jgi:hypothetical protein
MKSGLINVQDVDHMILCHLDIKSINRFYQTHRYAISRPHELWNNKILHDDLPLYLLDNPFTNVIHQIESYIVGLSMYKLLHTVKTKTLINLVINKIGQNDYKEGIVITLSKYEALKYVLPYNDLDNLNNMNSYKIILKQIDEKYELSLISIESIIHIATISLQMIVGIDEIISIILRSQYIYETQYATNPVSITDSLYVEFYVDDLVIEYHYENPRLNGAAWKNINKRSVMRETFLYMNDLKYLERLLYK